MQQLQLLFISYGHLKFVTDFLLTHLHLTSVTSSQALLRLGQFDHT